MVQNAEERKNILNHINLTKSKVVNVSEFSITIAAKVLANDWFLFKGTNCTTIKLIYKSNSIMNVE